MPWEESSYKPEYCEIVVEILATGRSLASVCADLGCCRSTLYKWRDDFPDFAKALNFGVQKAQSNWESIGRDGITGDNPDFSATPWIFTMKSRFREDYAEKKDDKSASDSLIEKLVDKLIE